MLNDEFSSESDKKIFYIRLIIIIVFLLFIARLFYLQLLKHKYYVKLADENVIRLVKLKPVRGKIITTDGVVVAESKPTFDVYLKPGGKTNEKQIRLLSSILEKDAKKLFTSLKSKNEFLIAQDVNKEKILKLYAHQEELSSLFIDIKSRRYYPYPLAFAHITGYSARMGIEKEYDEYLRGKEGYREIQVDATGKKIKVLSEDEPINGKDILLTVDWQLQNYIYQIMGDLEGAVVVLDPRDGKILAMVSKPSYNPNLFISPAKEEKLNKVFQDRGILENKALRGLYSPGSVIKPFIAVAALDLGIISDREKIDCPYSINIGIREYCDWKSGGFGKIDIYKAIEGSSDIFFYLLGMQVGINNIDYYLYKFGFGRKCGLYNCEHRGIIPSPQWKLNRTGERWYLGDTVSTAIGQGYTLVTPLQMAVAYMAIANGGTIYEPYIVSSIGDRKIPFAIRSHIKIDKKILDIVRKTMYLVVNGKNGTGKQARIDVLDICGKTGTSQVISKRVKINKIKNKEFMPHSWFASFAPLNNPQVVVVTLIEHGGSGGEIAAPLTKKIYKKLMELGYLKSKYRSI
ncbi:MAG: penicillin-binding protein 2 [Deltaproteobacteria bacterium]|nr:penicillin-binding protein 2 [Deltaproteobacteria bacterium]